MSASPRPSPISPADRAALFDAARAEAARLHHEAVDGFLDRLAAWMRGALRGRTRPAPAAFDDRCACPR